MKIPQFSPQPCRADSNRLYAYKITPALDGNGEEIPIDLSFFEHSIRYAKATSKPLRASLRLYATTLTTLQTSPAFQVHNYTPAPKFCYSHRYDGRLIGSDLLFGERLVLLSPLPRGMAWRVRKMWGYRVVRDDKLIQPAH